MRISDWSSDVCSSDLPVRPCEPPSGATAARYAAAAGDALRGLRRNCGGRECALPGYGRANGTGAESSRGRSAYRGAGSGERSEEHTSELQSLMRISYAVFCLKKKKKK